MPDKAMLAPVVALAGWTMIIWLWMYVTRLPAMARAGFDGMTKVGGTGKDLDSVLPERVQWKAHNYNHLHEAPTVFYAIALVLAVAGDSTGWATMLAWAYVGLRIAHSLVQILSNRVVVRFALFMLSSLLLVALTALAAAALA